MKKNDKIMITAGVIVVLIVLAGVFVFPPSSLTVEDASIESFFDVVGGLKSTPNGIVVSDSNPFYALIATPLAVHYNSDGEQECAPLYVYNYTNPSKSVTRAISQVNKPIDCSMDDTRSPKEWSIEIAKRYWSHSDAVMIIEYNKEGYDLGVVAAPIASYLSIPIIVTDSIDHSVQDIINRLNTDRFIICGGNLSGYGRVLRFTTVDDIVDAAVSLVKDKFGGVKYITITNPLDAHRFEVLDSTKIVLGPKRMRTQASTQLMQVLKKSDQLVGEFTIPKDYKYALVKFKGINLNVDHVNDLGDNVQFFCGVAPGEIKNLPEGLERFEIYAGGTNAGGVPVRDATGRIIEDSTYTEVVLYDRGGVKYQVTAIPNWLVDKEGDVKVEVVIEKLKDPRYPMMKGLSSLAPYLTAYRKGIIYGKTDFAYAADDHVLYQGKPSPGFSQPRRNPVLTGAFNDHVFNIHESINNLLAKIAGISLRKESDVKYLRDYYQHNPVYVALVGDGTMIPQLIYDSPIDPVSPPEEVAYYFGGGVPSDFIYGNIDPCTDERRWSSQAPDLYTEYPYQENIVGRITGWDAQDVSALITRTIFYDDIVASMGEWRRNAVVQLGGGNDFQKPFIRYKIFGELLKMIPRGEPMKMDTGASYLNGLTLQKKTLEPLGFNTVYIRENKATYQGFTDEAISKLKKANLLNMLLLSPRQLKKEVGVDVVKGKELQEASNFIFANAHGNQHMFGMGDVGLYSIGLGLPNGLLPRILRRLATLISYGPGFSLSDHGYYSTRNVEDMNLGPSFLFIESCICGKLDGMYPKQVITQAYLHAGCVAVISSTTSSNIAGGYIEPKNTKYDFPGQTLLRFIRAYRNTKKDVYPDLHFGFKIYNDLCNELRNNNVSLGLAFQKAKNKYLPEDASWKVWWSPPLLVTGVPDLDSRIMNLMRTGLSSDLNEHLDNKYMSFQEYTLYGDPAFTPYVPCRYS